MSQLTENTFTPGAIEIEARAAEWLQRRDREDWSAEQQVELDAWLADSSAHRLAYLRLHAAWNYADKLAALRRPRFNRILSSGGKIATTVFKTAAACAVLAAGGWLATNYFHKPQFRTFETPVGGRETLKLADGSQIELNTDTRIRISQGREVRRVWLDRGEAFFQVRHDAQRPFSVTIANHRVVDLGTKFLIRSENGAVHVSLLEGRARFDTNSMWGQPQSILLSPGDVVVATATSTSMERQPERALKNELGWRRGMLVFDRTPLSDVVAEFNRYNHERLSVSGPAALMKIDGTFPANGTADFLHLAEAVLGLKVRHTSEAILLVQSEHANSSKSF